MERSAHKTHLPQIDKVLRHPCLANWHSKIRQDLLVSLIRNEVSQLRKKLRKVNVVPTVDDVALTIEKKVEKLTAASARKVINATGVVLNTNLGRAPIPIEAVKMLEEVICGYTNLELDLESGKRSERGQRVEELLVLLTGAEAALVVNNNAAAVLLAVNTLSLAKEVVVSYGELVEIGGSFRLPEVIQAAGGILRAVGSTNRTRLNDYKRALSNKTGLLLKCHQSNFQLSGYTEETSIEDLASWSLVCKVPLLVDMGSGLIIDPLQLDSKNKNTITNVVKTGCHLATFSGDKLLGGPQAGIIVGKKSLIDVLRKSPIFRALRTDKVSLSILEFILIRYLSPNAPSSIPTLLLMATPASKLMERAQVFVKMARCQLQEIILEVLKTTSLAGGGSLPGQGQDSIGIKLHSSISANHLQALLRQASVPIIAPIHDNRVVVDFRSISQSEEEILLTSLLAVDKLIRKKSS